MLSLDTLLIRNKMKLINAFKQRYKEKIVHHNERFEWVDVAKGLGMFLICYGHALYAGFNPTINHLIYAFHVAFFFALSGFVFVVPKNEKFLTFLRKKAVRILIPLSIYIFLGLIIALVVDHIYDPLTLLRYFFYYDGTYFWNQACWFFITLFFVYIFGYLFNLPNRKMYLKIILLVSFLVIGYLLYVSRPYIREEVNPFSKFCIDRTIIVMVFFIFGAILKDIHKLINFSNNHFFLRPISFTSLGLWILFGYYLNPKVSIYGRSLGNYWFFIASSIFGTIFFFIFSIYIAKLRILSPILKLWGKNTLLIGGTNYLYFFMTWLFIVIFSPFGIPYTWAADIIIPFYTIIVMLIYIPIGFLIDRYLPYVSGSDPYFYKELRMKRNQK